MKRLLISLMLLVAMSSAVFAANSAQQGIHEPGTGLAQPELQAAGQGTGQGLQTQTETTAQQRLQVKAQTSAELGQMIQQRQQEMTQELQALGSASQEVYRNQNKVRLAVHSLLAVEDLAGGIGPQVSQIAREFDNSVQATIRSEEKIQSRSALARLFMGGDEEAADELEQEVNQNKLRLQQLTQLREQCTDCDEQVKATLQEQTQNMEQEQNRLQELAQNEKESKGLFGWLFK